LWKKIKGHFPLSKSEFRERLASLTQILEKWQNALYECINSLSEYKKENINCHEEIREITENTIQLKNSIEINDEKIVGIILDETEKLRGQLQEQKQLQEQLQKQLQEQLQEQLQKQLQEQLQKQLQKQKTQDFECFHLLESELKNLMTEQRAYYSEIKKLFDNINHDILQINNRVTANERILTYYKEQNELMFWQLYKSPQETEKAAKERFFLSLSPAVGKLRDTQLLENVLLNEIKRICDAHDLKYWLWGGSLLGAVRHKGFIPWDDDIDIGMMRSDLKEFEDILKANMEFELVNVYDACVFCKQMRFKFRKKDIPVFVDIFVYDFANDFSQESTQKMQYIKRKLFEELLTSNDSNVISFRSRTLTQESSTDGMIIKAIFEKYNMDLINEKIVVGGNDNPKGLFYGIDNYDPNLSGIMPLDEYFPLKSLTFEGQSYYVPNNYEKILHGLYGDDFFSFPKGEPHFVHLDISSNYKNILDELNARGINANVSDPN